MSGGGYHPANCMNQMETMLVTRNASSRESSPLSCTSPAPLYKPGTWRTDVRGHGEHFWHATEVVPCPFRGVRSCLIGRSFAAWQ
jgi:hypothetical protein